MKTSQILANENAVAKEILNALDSIEHHIGIKAARIKNKFNFGLEEQIWIQGQIFYYLADIYQKQYK